MAEKQPSAETAAIGAEFVKRLLADDVSYPVALRTFKQQLVAAALEQEKSKSAAGRKLKVTRNYVRTLSKSSAAGNTAEKEGS